MTWGNVCAVTSAKKQIQAEKKAWNTSDCVICEHLDFNKWLFLKGRVINV